MNKQTQESEAMAGGAGMFRQVKGRLFDELGELIFSYSSNEDGTITFDMNGEYVTKPCLAERVTDIHIVSKAKATCDDNLVIELESARSELEAANAELSTIYQWVRERRDYVILSLTDEVTELNEQLHQLRQEIIKLEIAAGKQP